MFFILIHQKIYLRRYLSDDEEHLRNMYNIALDLEEGEHLCIDLPPDLGNDVQRLKF